MERKIGEKFEYQGVALEVCAEEDEYWPCKGCYFDGNKCLSWENWNGLDGMDCFCATRQDLENVIFKPI